MLGTGVAVLAVAFGCSEPEEKTEPAAPDSVEDAIRVSAEVACLEHKRLVVAVEGNLNLGIGDLEIVVRQDTANPEQIVFAVVRGEVVLGTREFTPALVSCEELHAIVGFSIAYMVDEIQLLQPKPKPKPKPQPQPKPKPIPKLVEPIPIVDDRRIEVRVGTGVGLSFDAPPTLGGQAELSAELGWRGPRHGNLDLRIAAIGGVAAFEPAGSGKISQSVFGARGDACGGFTHKRLRARGCAGVLAGAAIARGRGFRQDGASRLPWLAIAVGGDLGVELRPGLRLEVGVDALLHAVRPAFDVKDGNGVRIVGQEFPRVGAVFSLGLILTVF